MKIVSLVLEYFTKFKVSRIKKLSLKTESDIQIIIGSNGSGKSSLLHELFPYPPVKTVFNREGYKELALIHGGLEYLLIYTPENGHLFYKDGVNLNKNGTNEIQRELIDEHLGLNNGKHQILKCSLPICSMRPSQRKQALMGLNPIDISLFIDKHKEVRKATTAIGNNLDRLYKRQEELMSQQLPEEKYKELLAVKEKYENQEKLLLMWITKANSIIEQLPDVTNDTGLSDADNVLPTVKSIYNRLSAYTDIDRESFEQRMASLPIQIDMTEKDIVELDNSLSGIVTEIDNYERKLSNINDSDEDLGKKLATLIEYSEKFSFSNTFIPLSEDDITNAPKLIEEINTWLTNITYIDFHRILSKEEYKNLRTKLSEYDDELKSLNMQMSHVVKRARDSKKLIKEYETADDCHPDKCELFNKYNAHVSAKKAEYERLIKERDRYEKKIKALEETYNKLNTVFETQTLVWKHVDHIFNLLSGSISRYINMSELVPLIEQAPLSIIAKLNKYVAESESYLNYQKILNKIDELKKDEETRESKMKFSSEVLNIELKKYNAKLEETRKRHTEKVTKLESMLKELKLFDEFAKDKDILEDLLKDIDSFENYKTIEASYEYTLKLLKILNDTLIKLRRELSEVTEISREQESLSTRLDKEVNSVINELREKHIESKAVESALFELPINYTKTFINNVITTTNYFISEIMTYQMALANVEDTLDFTFPLVVEGVLVKDISNCSMGQKAVFTLAFNLALVIELKLNDYPIYIDEVDRDLDAAHKEKLSNLITMLVDKEIVSQIFIVGHHKSMLDGFSGDITVLNGDNVILPAIYNENAEIEYL